MSSWKNTTSAYSDKDLIGSYVERNRENVKLKEIIGSFVLKIRKEHQRSRILDLGCGHGRDCFYIRNAGAEKVVGVDYSEGFIAVANELFETARTANFSIEDVSENQLAYAGTGDVTWGNFLLTKL